MRLRSRLLVLSVSTVAVIVTVLSALHLDSLTKTWVESAAERSLEAGRFIQSVIVLHIADSSANSPTASVEQTKRNWTRIVSEDKDLADRLVEQTAMPNGVIVEINIIGEDGNVILSSIPSRTGQPAPVRQSLASISEAGFLDRLSAIVKPEADYETHIPLGIMSDPDQQPVFEIQLLVSSSLLQEKIKPDLREFGIVSLFGLLAAAVLAGVSAHLALLPVRRIGKAIDTLSTGRPLGLTLPEDDRDDREVAAIEYKLSLLGEQMQKGAQRDADQRMRSAIGTLARGVAHEIKNPLNAISLRLESLRMRISDEVPEAEGEIDLVSDEVHRLDRVVRTFLDLNRPMELDIKEFDPGELAGAALEIMQPAAQQAHVAMKLIRPPKPFFVEADRGLIEQGLVNIINNAIQALSGSGGTDCLITTTISLNNNTCEIAVADNGPGMPVNVQERIFEPYFTTKPSGSGIGLAFTKRAMELHGGAISVTSAPGHGTTMILSFPVSRRRS
jgi:signal transduction histidine kinase